VGSAVKKIALLGVGKIARDQHLPALASSDSLELVAAIDQRSPIADVPDTVPIFHDIHAMLASGIAVDAVSICTPPACRYSLARAAIDSGLHVMLEKPPAANIIEVRDLEARARQRGVTLFTTWHSREARGVEPARVWLSERTIQSVHVLWKEDIRVWHPGQHWILQAGGMGVFDPGINALSILTRILPGKLTLQAATLDFPSNCQSPLAAELLFSHPGSVRVEATFDFLYEGPPCWDIEVRTDKETLRLTEGGHRLNLDETPYLAGLNEEYARLYQRFASLIATGDSDVDPTPLQLVEDALLIGERRQTAAFHF
jgi:D-galactose 1-dehydrogenase